MTIALYGGEPVRSQTLPYGRQLIEDDDIAAVVETLKSDYLTTGPEVLKFEEAFAKKVGAKYAVAVSNGTAALHIACLAAGVGELDEVITTPLTFAASANAALYCGAKPLFADIDPASLNIDPQNVKALITDRTKVLLPVHYAGLPCDMAKLLDLAKAHGLVVIEDASHALGATYEGRTIGTIGDMTTFSLHPVKHMTTGEGGVITTNSEYFYKKLLLYRTHGITRDTAQMSKESEGPWYYEQLELGYNYRITDFQCALGMSQLKKIERYQESRDQIAKLYDEAFSEIKGLMIQESQANAKNVHHLYVLRFDPELIKTDRLTFFKALQAEGIGVNVHYVPVYKHPYYQANGFSHVSCVEAEKAYAYMVSLPMFHGMTMADAKDVVAAVKKVSEYFSK